VPEEAVVAYRMLGVAIAALHFGYLAYLLLGGYLALRWPRTFVLHLIIVAWAVLVVTVHAPCPLTRLQNNLRTRGGQPKLGDSFLNSYVRGVFYPAGHESTVRGVVGAWVVISWIILAVRWQAKRRRRNERAAAR
jgi:hypothetical protein